MSPSELSAVPPNQPDRQAPEWSRRASHGYALAFALGVAALLMSACGVESSTRAYEETGDDAESGGSSSPPSHPLANGGAPTGLGGASSEGGSLNLGGSVAGGVAGSAVSSECPPAGSLLYTNVEDPALDKLWFPLADGTATGQSSALVIQEAATRTAHAAGSGYTDWGAGIGLSLIGRASCFDLSRYSGVRFRAKGSGTVTVAAATRDTLPLAEGGDCTSGCYDYHSTTLTLTPTWASYTVSWSQLGQAGWGTPATLLAGRVSSLQLTTDTMPYDFSIDDVEFVEGPAVEPGDPCAAPGLSWSTARKTEYESHPEPGSTECVEYNGCTWAGQFAACPGTQKTERWVSERDIAAVFPAFDSLELHRLCIRSGGKTMLVTVYDRCNDADCNGCCTAAKGSQPLLIDLEKHTADRFGVADGTIEWVDVGPAPANACQ